MATGDAPQLSLADISTILGQPKVTVRPMEWVEKKSGRNPLWLEYVSACKFGVEVREDVLVRMQFRDRSLRNIGNATIEASEQFNAAICVGKNRIYAIDTTDRPHLNSAGAGRPFYRQLILERTHEHTWSPEGYGYAEPLIPPLLSVESLVEEFLRRANVVLIGGFVHPLKGKQRELGL
jgi:hypothetical protein